MGKCRFLMLWAYFRCFEHVMGLQSGLRIHPPIWRPKCSKKFTRVTILWRYKMLDAFSINWVDKSKNVTIDFFSIIALRKDDINMANISKIEIKTRPSILDNIYIYRVGRFLRTMMIWWDSYNALISVKPRR